ncbi:IucA/IucC family protein [Actinopolyspora halophila]|uniref:IucA/IucC family protein n=1 Tax=Actinopolyspora halophila TaxID=1850 RepID=UPI0003735298|nr:IucA/IucC family siderophore biosynthesis protein [Actinopolyspora halophila]
MSSAAAPREAAAHLTPHHWETANRLLVRKALAEFSHERLLEPAETAPGHYRVSSDDGLVEYHFTAEMGSLRHWRVDADSITRHSEGSEQPLDALALFLEFRKTLGLRTEMLPVYLEEISSTLSSSAFKLAMPATRSAELLDAGFQAVESGLTEGHPCFVANSGRIGFDSTEFTAYAPEAGQAVSLVWMAAHRDRSTFTVSSETSYAELISSELDEEERAGFAAGLRERGLDPEEYHLFPVHPWQWENKLSVTFAAEVARNNLVHLGRGTDAYRPQQSVRTMFNESSPSKHYVKTALSVLNMGFLRGLSAEYMKATPAINDWLAGVIARDRQLADSGFDILRERAAIGYHNEYYEAAGSKSSPYRKMLAALWRESPVPKIRSGQRLVSMAALLHVDRFGDSVLGELVSRSGLEPAVWLRRYLDVYLRPLLHLFYAHDLVTMPHGENIILVLEDGVPEGALLKDIAEEVAVLDADAELPPEVERIRSVVPEHLRELSLLTDVFDCFFRFLCSIASTEGVLSEEVFWRTVAECVADYQRDNPELRDKFRRHDLFTEWFSLSCLNRLQLGDNEQMVDLQDPSSALAFAGTLSNPIAPHAPELVQR